MAIWMIPVGMAAAGAVKGVMDEKAADKKRKAEGTIAQWSPWTGMSAQRVENSPGFLGGAMQGGMAGMGMMQAAQNAGYGKEAAAAPSSTSAGTPAPTPTYSLYGNQGGPAMAQQDYSQYENSPIMQGNHLSPSQRASMWTAR